MEFYQFIHNENDIRQFYDFLGLDYFIVQILARQKYDPNLKNGQNQIVLAPIRVKDFDQFLTKLKRYQIQNGLYTMMISDQIYPIPLSGMAMYMNINPFDPIKAGRNLIKEMTNHVYDNIGNSDTGIIEQKFKFLDKELLSELIKTCRYDVLHFDIDEKTDQTVQKIKTLFDEILPDGFDRENKILIIQTKNGYHVLIKMNSSEKFIINTVHKYLKSAKDFEIVLCHKNNSCIIPGTVQGGFPAGIIQPSDFQKI
jgi:hypothetical protein